MKTTIHKWNEDRSFPFCINRRMVALAAMAAFCMAPFVQSTEASPLSVDGIEQDSGKVTVKGVVKSPDGEPLIGATVMELGTKNATVTDLDGQFTLNVNRGARLVFSYIGYKTMTVAAANSATVTLEEYNRMLNDVVVVGYGTKKIEDITGAVSNIRADKTNLGGAATSVNQMLEGHIAGVQFKQNTAQPGGGGKTIIRGRNSLFLSTDPLYVVDGFIVNTPSTPGNGDSQFSSPSRDPLNSINPDDIESIAVLKDAAATSIYGSQGSNGVIIITTKKGKSGRVNVGYNMYAGFQKRANKLDLMNAQQYMRYQNGLGLTKYTDAEIAAAKTTDWQNEISRTGIIQSHDLSISGGTEKMKFYASLGYYDMKGVLKNSAMQRFSGRGNIEYKDNKFTFLSNLSASQITDSNLSTEGGRRNSVISAATAFAPNLSIYDENGVYSVDPNNNMIANPVSILDIKDKIRTDRVTFSNSFQYEILPGLKPELKISYDVSNAHRDFYVPTTTAYNGGFAHGGTGSQSSLRSTGLTLDGLLHYDVTFNKVHKITALLGYEYYQRDNNFFMGYNSGFGTDATENSNLGGGNAPLLGSSKTRRRDISAFGRLDYGFGEKYLATVTLRRDGSSVFGRNNKFAWFPGVSVGWRLDKEDFLKNTNVDMLKLRLGYGLSGNSGIEPYQSLARYALATDAVIGGSKVTDALLTEYKENPDLKWETTSQLNIGVDYGFFGRLAGSLDFFVKNTKDMLVQVSQDPMSGHSYQWQNAAKMRVWGLEFSLNSTNIQTNKFQWTTNFNFSWMDNEITGYKVNDASTISALNDIGVIKGERTNSYYTYVVDGIDPKTGSYTYKDLDKDGSVTVKDKAILGSPDPKFIVGLGNTFKYEELTLDIFFNANFGNKLYNYTRMNNLLSNGFEVTNYQVGAENYWTSTNTNTMLAANRANGNGNAQYNSLWIEDAWFIRLQNLRLSYNFSKIPSLSKIFSNATVYFQVQNLFCITPYDGLDPELTNNAYMKKSENLPAFLPGSIDMNSYYPARTFTFGLNLHF